MAKKIDTLWNKEVTTINTIRDTIIQQYSMLCSLFMRLFIFSFKFYFSNFLLCFCSWLYGLVSLSRKYMVFMYIIFNLTRWIAVCSPTKWNGKILFYSRKDVFFLSCAVCCMCECMNDVKCIVYMSAATAFNTLYNHQTYIQYIVHTHTRFTFFFGELS